LNKKKNGSTSTSEIRGLIWLETPLNPKCDLQDIRAFSDMAEVLNFVVVVDSTFATPVLQKPLSLGAHFVLHSSSKFLGGHSDLLGGVIVAKKETEAHALAKQRYVNGSVPGNLEVWLLLRSIRTLDVRVSQHSRTTHQIALWLQEQVTKKNRHITKVWYPTVSSDPQDARLLQTQMQGRGPGVLSIELDTPENTLKFHKGLKLFANATSLGGFESIVDHRYRWDKTCSETLLRLSIGLESSKDLIQDLDNALKSLD